MGNKLNNINKQKILIFGMTANPGGVESVIMNYYRKLNKDKFLIDFLCISDTIAYEEEIINSGATIIKITPRRKNPIRFYRELRKIFKENNYDAVWVNTCDLSNVTYLRFAKKFKVKTRIIHSHNSANMSTFIRLMMHKFNRFLIGRLATHHWSCGKLASEWFYRKKIIESPSHKIIKNAIDIEKFAYNQEIRDRVRHEMGLTDKIVIGHVGRFHFQKNHEFLIKVFKECHNKNPDTILLLIGQGEEEIKIKQLVLDYNLESSVIFLGARGDVNNIFQAMDIFLFPSLFEGLPVVMVEAQVSGLPIIAADTISQEARLTDKVKFLSLKNTEQNWAEFVLAEDNLLCDREKYSKTFINSDFDINKQVVDFEKIIDGDV